MNFIKARRATRIGVTLMIVAAAGFASVVIWNHYLTGPWTRDGQIQAEIVSIAPEVSGRITKLNVGDNQTVQRGDVLYEIDAIDYQVAVAAAEADVQSRLADMTLKQGQAERRTVLTTLSTSEEERQSYQSAAKVAEAAYATALTHLSTAKINLGRTKVLAPVNGYVTNLLVRKGDYATQGARNISVLDSDSFWAIGYFEETKIAGIHVGDAATVALMGFKDPVYGHVESLARGINTPNIDPGTLGLATVTPVFTWVRLAQRIPVHIHIDTVPPTVHLASGLTATISVGANAGPGARQGGLSRAVFRTGG